MIILINGPLGVGKTEVSWKLVEYFERGVMLDGDFIGALHPQDIHDPEQTEYLYQAIHNLAAFHVERGGYRNFVVNYVFETPESLARLRRLLSDLDDEIYAFRLVCSAEEGAKRIEMRCQALPKEPGRLEWELARYGELSAIQEAAAKRGDMGFVVETTGLSAPGTAQAIWDNIHERVELAPYNSGWPARYQDEQEAIRAVMGPLALAVHHIGSTAVPGLDAKPVIDILVVVHCLEDAVECIAPLTSLGYAFIDYPQNTERRFFRKGLPRTHHLHIVAQGNTEQFDHLDFRDALRADPELRRQYQALKHELARRYQNDRATYSARKGRFVRQALERYRQRAP